MGVPLAESFSVPAFLEETAEARSNASASTKEYCLLFPFCNKKNEDLFGIWILGFGVLSPIRYTARRC